MPIVCNLLQVPSDGTDLLTASPAKLREAMDTATTRSDVYRYWDGIRYLLGKHRAGSVAGQWTSCGKQVSAPAEGVPGTRVLASAEVASLASELANIEPDELAPHYDAAELDGAGVYPSCWQEWEESFDPLGQLLEHYFFLKQFVEQARKDGSGILLEFAKLEDGTYP